METFENLTKKLGTLQTTLVPQLKTALLQYALQGKLTSKEFGRVDGQAESLSLHNGFAKGEPLPTGWKWGKLGEVATLDNGTKQSGISYPNIDANFLRTGQVTKTLTEGRFVRANSLLILVDGENSGEVFRTPIDGYQGSTFKSLIIEKTINETYVLYFIRSHQRELHETKVDSAIPHLNKKLFRDLDIPLPPLVEQEVIVKKLDALFEVLDRLANI